MADQLLSNRVVIIVASLLAIGILLDGKAYNRPPQLQPAYSIQNARTVTVRQNDQTIMAFEKQTDQWMLTTPVNAPARTERVQVLIDSNYQTNRSYAAMNLPLTELFSNAIELEIDGHPFKLGNIEPVSKMRYVLAADKVYLQADHVIPMLRASTSAFVDLAITSAVTGVTIDDIKQANPQSWSGLRALGIISRENITEDAAASVVVKQETSDRQFNLHYQQGSTLLISPQQAFGYILSPEQIIQLNLAAFN